MIELAAKLSAGRYLAAYLGQVSGQPGTATRGWGLGHSNNDTRSLDL